MREQLGRRGACRVRRSRGTCPAATAAISVSRGQAAAKRRAAPGTRIFVLPETETGNELWLDTGGMFKRFILREDVEREHSLIALPARQFRIDDARYRGEVQHEYRDTVSIRDIGSYGLISGSIARERALLHFTGNTLGGEWELAKIDPDKRHRSWRFAPT